MLFMRAFRSWCLSVLACVGVLAVWGVVMQLTSGRTAHLLHNVFDVSIAFGAVFAVIGAVVYIPAFVILEALLHHRLNRSRAVLLGAGLAPAVSLAIASQFRESEDPASLAALLTYWATHLPGLVFGSLPFAAAGAGVRCALVGPSRERVARSQIGWQALISFKCVGVLVHGEPKHRLDLQP